MSLVEMETEHGLDSGGGPWERLDASRRKIVELCGEKGKALFLFLLESSTIMPGQDDVAVFSQQRLCDVALQLGWSPDTVKRYVAVFRAVNLVHHYHDCRREVRLHIPLGPYVSLTNFTVLDELIGKRKKQRQLALKVKTHYIMRFGDPTQTHSDEMRTKLQELTAILDNEHLEPLKRQRLQMKIADLIAHFAKGYFMGDSKHLLGDQPATPERQKPGTSFDEGGSNETMEAFCLAKRGAQRKEPGHEGDSNGQQGDSTISTSSTSGRDTRQVGDSNQQLGDSTPYALRQQGHYAQATQYKLGDSNQPQGDLTAQDRVQSSQKEGQMGDSKVQVVLKKGDSNLQAVVEVNANTPYTYNITYLINNITGDNVIRKRLAQFLASVLEKSEYENGYPTFSKYLKAFKLYSPDVIGRAFLATMFLLHRKNWQTSPGATFTNQCKVLSGQKPLAHYTLDDVEEWLRIWGHLPYPELIVAMAAPPPAQQLPEPAALITTPRQDSPASHGLPGYTGGGASIKKKRTYGLQYTGRPITVNKGTHNLSGPTRPSEKS